MMKEQINFVCNKVWYDGSYLEKCVTSHPIQVSRVKGELVEKSIFRPALPLKKEFNNSILMNRPFTG